MASVCSLQVEGDAAFGRVVVPEGQAALRMREIVEEWPNAAGRLATGGFDLDDIGAQVAQEFAAKLPLIVGQLENSQACPRKIFGAPPCWSRGLSERQNKYLQGKDFRRAAETRNFILHLKAIPCLMGELLWPFSCHKGSLNPRKALAAS